MDSAEKTHQRPDQATSPRAQYYKNWRTNNRDKYNAYYRSYTAAKRAEKFKLEFDRYVKENNLVVTSAAGN